MSLRNQMETIEKPIGNLQYSEWKTFENSWRDRKERLRYASKESYKQRTSEDNMNNANPKPEPKPTSKAKAQADAKTQAPADARARAKANAKAKGKPQTKSKAKSKPKQRLKKKACQLDDFSRDGEHFQTYQCNAHNKGVNIILLQLKHPTGNLIVATQAVWCHNNNEQTERSRYAIGNTNTRNNDNKSAASLIQN